MSSPPSWPPVLPAGTLVHCGDCGERPAMIAPNGDGSVDLLCSECRLILATLSRPL